MPISSRMARKLARKRAASLSPERRSEIARGAVLARWKLYRKRKRAEAKRLREQVRHAEKAA